MFFGGLGRSTAYLTYYPAVRLAASVFKEERDKVMMAGMDDFIRKSYQAEEIFGCPARQLEVRFVHEEAPTAAAGGEPAMVLHPEALATLSQELRMELTDAMVDLDVARIDEIIHRVSELDPTLGDALAHLAD